MEKTNISSIFPLDCVHLESSTQIDTRVNPVRQVLFLSLVSLKSLSALPVLSMVYVKTVSYGLKLAI